MEKVAADDHLALMASSFLAVDLAAVEAVPSVAEEEAVSKAFPAVADLDPVVVALAEAGNFCPNVPPILYLSSPRSARSASGRFGDDAERPSPGRVIIAVMFRRLLICDGCHH